MMSLRIAVWVAFCAVASFFSWIAPRAAAAPPTVHAYLDSANSNDTIVLQLEQTPVEFRLVAENITDGIRAFEVHVYDINGPEGTMQPLSAGRIVESGEPPLHVDEWWYVEFDDCVQPDAYGRIPLIGAELLVSGRYLLDSPTVRPGLFPSGYRNCEGQIVVFNGLEAGVINPSDPSCVVSPLALDFRCAAVGDTVRRQVTVTNHFLDRDLEGTVRIEASRPLGADSFSVEGDSTYVLSPGASQSFVVAFTPNAHTDFSCEISVHDEIWYCSKVTAKGSGGPHVVASFSPDVIKQCIMDDYPAQLPAAVWFGLAGMDSVTGFRGVPEALPEDLQVTGLTTLVPVTPESVLAPDLWDLEFGQCLAVAPGEILWFARAVIAPLAGSPPVVYGPKYSLLWRDCQGADQPFNPWLPNRQVIMGCSEGIGGAGRPIAEPLASLQSGPVPLSVDFSANAHDVDGPASELSYFWLFGDGNYSTEQDPSHDFAEPGNYAVWLNVFDGVGDTNVNLGVQVLPSLSGVSSPKAGEVVLGPARPNPFNPDVRLSFSLPAATHAMLSVHALDGSLVAVLVDGDLQAGPHQYTWRAKDRQARTVPSGCYLVQLETSLGRAQQKIVLLQ